LLATDAAITHLNNNCGWTGSQSTDNTGLYCFAVEGVGGKALDRGTYTITFYLNDSNGNARATQVVKYTAVSTSALSGAVLTASALGKPSAGLAWTSSATSYFKATLTDANGGRLVTSDTTSASTIVPAISAELTTSTGTLLNNLSAFDTYNATAWTNDYGSATASVANDGVYLLVPQGVISSSISTTAASTLRVLYGTSSATASVSAVAAGASIPSASLRTVSGTGLYTTNTTDSGTANASITYSVPLSTTTVKVYITTKSASATLVNEPLTITPTWTNNNAGDVSPKSATPVVYYSDSNGVITYTVTQNNPIAGSSVSIAPTGQASGAGSYGTITLNWGVPAVTTISTTPGSSFKSVAGSATKWTATVLDQFGKPMSGIVLQPSLSSTSANYSTTAMATVTTGADGTASVTLTGGAALTSDTLTFTNVTNGTSVASTAIKASYVATLPVIASMTGYYATNESGTPSTPFSTTAIGASSGMTTVPTVNYTGALVAGSTTTDAINLFQVTTLDSAGAIVSGVPVTVTASAGSYFTDSCTGATGLLVTTKVCYPNSTTGNISILGVSTKTATATFTFTAGAVTASQSVNVINAVTDARFVKLSASGNEVTASVTDRFGNPIAGQNIQLSTSATGTTLGAGAKTGVYTTDTTGTVVVALDGIGDTTVTAYLSNAQDTTSSAGFYGSNQIDSTVAAGNRSASVALTVTNTSATDAVDAANEATDAANAATDAANAAAEAADAATAAAQDAQAAVAALATQVADLISDLKAQITALTNLVIKIQKKVKA